MTVPEKRRALATAVAAARAAGKLMRENLRAPKIVNQATQHDLKLELDVRCQKRIEKTLRGRFPGVPVLGEEGILGDPQAPVRWVVDPIDGTVNFCYGIPHACVSIALQVRTLESRIQRHHSIRRRASRSVAPFRSIVGVVYDPFCEELWTAMRGQPARLNGTIIRVSRRRKLREAIVALGFAKEPRTLKKMLPTFNALIHRVRKIRIMGAAALGLAYVATGRMEAYIEHGLRLWDVAAGGLIVECAGGAFRCAGLEGDYACEIIASNGLLQRRLYTKI